MVWIEVGSSEDVTHRMLFTNFSSGGLRPQTVPAALVPISLDPENPKITLDNFTLCLTPSEVEAIKQWITRNYPILLAHWNGETDSYEATLQLQAA